MTSGEPQPVAMPSAETLRSIRDQERLAKPYVRRCTICGDDEPWHVHDGERRIDDYFTVGRGQTEFMAAEAWRKRALEAERELERIISG